MSQVDVRVPDPGDSTEIEVLSVQVSEGDAVAAGEALLEVASDKANMEVAAPSAGVVVSVNVAPGDVVEPDAVLVVLGGGQ